VRTRPTFRSELQIALAKSTKEINLPDRAVRERLQGFLASPEGEALVRQLFAFIIGQAGSDVRERVEAALTSSLTLLVGKSTAEHVAPLVLSALHTACTTALDLAFSDGGGSTARMRSEDLPPFLSSGLPLLAELQSGRSTTLGSLDDTLDYERVSTVGRDRLLYCPADV
jgi:hypothetical protein